MITKHNVDADGHPIAVWEKSPVEAQGAIVLLHGRTWSARPNYDLQVPGEDLSLMDGLVEAGYAAFAIDFRGYGETPRDETGWLSPDRAARDLKAVLEHVGNLTEGGPRPALLGWSRGSKVAQLTLQRWPDLVSSFVFFGYSPTFAGAPLADGEGDTPPAAAPNSAAAAASEWDELDPTQVLVPTLLLHAEFDPIVTPEQRASLFRALGTPDRESLEVSGGDHMTFLESCRPEFLKALVGFLDRNRGGF